MKKKDLVKACQTSAAAHPDRAPEGKTTATGLRSSPLSIQPAREAPTAILADRARVKSSQTRRRGTLSRNFHSRAAGIFAHQPGWDL
ncbi:hypothetical protein F5Y19DRAFT_449031 [Xylariaceae sp. FL1651]|nr:hypothetical protein F5Y19DRAFT_449031 [Xylariaceae sp. FL1651]